MTTTTTLSEQHITTIKDAARKLTGNKRRAFQAQVCIDYLDSSPRKAERAFGWDRNAVQLGLHELRTGIVCIDNFRACGNKKTEEKNEKLKFDICELAEPNSQVDPKFQTPFKYTRLTAKAMRKALMEEKGWLNEELPCEKTIGNILNRMGYRLRRVQKARPIKKVKAVDAIFDSIISIRPIGSPTSGKTRYEYRSIPRPKWIYATPLAAERQEARRWCRLTTTIWGINPSWCLSVSWRW